jgi:hypothetical protein
LLIAALLVATAMTQPVALAERQPSINLFPQNTLAFLRTPNAKEFADRLKDSSMGRMFDDPQVKPLVDRVMGQVSQLYSENVEQELGFSWDQLLNLPKGELAIGVIAMPAASPAILAIIDQDTEEPTVARSLLNRLITKAQDEGLSLSKEMIGDVECTVVRDDAHPERSLGVFEREGTIVVATHPNLLRHVLFHWDGTKALPDAGATTDDAEFIPGPSLNTNQKFTDIIAQCRRPNDPIPNLVIYADPIELARQLGRTQPAVMIALAFLPQLGLDGILAVGGASTVSTGAFDGLTHMHILLENPRAGILSMLSFQPGDYTPQPWVPAEIETYGTARWNFQSFYARLMAIVDGFQGEGAFNEAVGGPLSRELGIDLKTQVVDNLTGRMTLVAGFETPVRLQGRHNILALELNDEAGAQNVLQTIVNRESENFDRRQFGQATYYAIKVGATADMPAEQRPFNPFVAVYDKHLFAGTSINLFEKLVAARQGETPRLADSEAYARVAGTFSDATAGVPPAVVFVQQPEFSWKFWYELLNQESTRTFINEAAAENEIVERFAAILRDGGLPPFEALKKYLAPAGAVLYDTDNGFHGISFTLRNAQ